MNQSIESTEIGVHLIILLDKDLLFHYWITLSINKASILWVSTQKYANVLNKFAYHCPVLWFFIPVYDGTNLFKRELWLKLAQG